MRLLLTKFATFLTSGMMLGQLVRRSNVMVGVHGAGLMHIMYGPEEAVLVEIHPSYRLDRHFRHAARLTGKVRSARVLLAAVALTRALTSNFAPDAGVHADAIHESRHMPRYIR